MFGSNPSTLIIHTTTTSFQTLLTMQNVNEFHEEIGFKIFIIGHSGKGERR